MFHLKQVGVFRDLSRNIMLLGVCLVSYVYVVNPNYIRNSIAGNVEIGVKSSSLDVKLSSLDVKLSSLDVKFSSLYVKLSSLD